jgi:hypothetical protein
VTLPFFSQAFPHGVPVFMLTVLLMLMAGIVVSGIRFGIREISTGPLPYLMVIAFVAAAYIYGLLIDKGPEPVDVARELANGIAAMALVFVACNAQWNSDDAERVVRNVCKAIVAFAGVAAVAGLYKLYRLLNGELLSWIASEGRNYPWGTSLVADYNYYALTMLVAMLAIIVLVRGAGRRKQLPLALLFLMFLIVGALAGSRRFWVAAPIFVLLQMFWAVRSGQCGREVVTSFTKTVAVIVSIAAGLAFILFPEKVSNYVALAWTFEERFSSILNPGQGLTARASRWAFALQNLGGTVPWTGAGFHYMTSFGCEFVNCAGAGYPHMPLLSAFLFAGIFGLVAGLLMYAVIVSSAIALMRSSNSLAAGLVVPLAATLLFSSISGNGPLSSRGFLVVGSLVVFLAHHLYRTQTRTRADSISGKA